MGDRIKIAGYEGVIVDMGLRSSRLRTREGRVVIIPNSLFATSPIENAGFSQSIRVSQTLLLKRTGSVRELKAILELVKDACVAGAGNAIEPEAALQAMNSGAWELAIVYFVERDADYLSTVHRVNTEILSRLEQANVALA
jgi:MscS family membrane protein